IQMDPQQKQRLSSVMKVQMSLTSLHQISLRLNAVQPKANLGRQLRFQRSLSP
ncbi:hypothetical protein M9458_049180, partial [Cirrhinus mrigala]